MTEFTPHLAPIVALLFLGTILLLGVCCLVLFAGAVCRSSFLGKLGAGGALAIAAAYFILLTSVSMTSSEKVLPPGGWKVFCEIDCHIWYSLADTHVAAALGPEREPTTAKGRFVIVRLKTWFNEKTISPRRGNRPLVPSPRRVLLVDESGSSFGVSSEGQAALSALGGLLVPLDQALRPSESFTTDFVFDVPKTARGLRLLIADDDPATRFVIGHENSMFHKKIYLGLDAQRALAREGFAFERVSAE